MIERFISNKSIVINRRIIMRILKTYTGMVIPDTITKHAPKPQQSIKDGGTTQGTTKSGTIIFVEGENEARRKRALQYFLKVYNNDFSTGEQKKNGNLVYELTSKITRKGFASASIGWPDKTEKKKYHVSGRKIYILSFTDRSAKSEFAITHELVHTRKFAANIKGDKHDEQKIDFETVGRISKGGIKQTINPKTPYPGTYFTISSNDKSHPGNKYLYKLKLPHDKKLKVASEGLVRDRKLLTGSINTNIVGRVASTRAEKLFPKSFFNIKYVIDKKKK
jgi:hypothetical protein